MLADSPLVQSNNDLRFWTSRIALCIYSNILLALFFRQFWVLYGVAFILTTQIAMVLRKWVAFVESDPQYSEFQKFMHQNFRVVLDEYDKLTNGRYGSAKLAAGRLAAEVGLKVMMEKLVRAQGNFRSIRDALENQLNEHRISLSRYQATQRRLSFATDDSSSSSSLTFRETDA
jgi:hypothetical protein